MYAGVHSILGWNPYWVDATVIGCDGQFEWCRKHESIPNWFAWRYKIPPINQTDSCVELEYTINPFTHSAQNQYFHINTCTESIYFICEVNSILYIQ
jgi:hypothetical protein